MYPNISNTEDNFPYLYLLVEGKLFTDKDMDGHRISHTCTCNTKQLFVAKYSRTIFITNKIYMEWGYYNKYKHGR